MLPPTDTIAVAQPEPATQLETNVVATQGIRSTKKDFARSEPCNWSPPVPITHEPKALQSLTAEWKALSNQVPTFDGYTTKKQIVIVDLHDFEIYRSPLAGHEARRYELTSLHHLEVSQVKKLCFDGFLCIGKTKHYVQTIAIQNSSIEGFNNDEDPGVVAYVQSELASKDTGHDIWYRLRNPTLEYKRFHEAFLWVAQLSKHVIDYMSEQPARSVGLESFRTNFHRWIIARFPWRRSKEFRKWHHEFRDQVDFRVSVNRHSDYIYHQACHLPNSKELLNHPMWSEGMVGGLKSIKEQPRVVKHTLCTQHVYESFEGMYFGTQLRKMEPSEIVGAVHKRRKHKLGFPSVRTVSASALSTSAPTCRPYGTSRVRVGDVVAMNPDKRDLKRWKSNAGRDWLAYVQGVTLLDDGTQRLSVLWLYQPCDTNLYKAKYPFEHELFFSDNCNCTEGELLSTELNGKYDVDWSPKTIDRRKGFFIRQTYITQESAFVTFREEHKVCACKKEKTSSIDNYRPFDTVYMKRTYRTRLFLEPVIIHHIDKATKTVKVRKLLRLARDCMELAMTVHRTDIAPNELILTDEYEEVSTSRIERRCFIRFVPKHSTLEHQVPFPYNQGGAGDLWFISMCLDSTRCLKFLDRAPYCFYEGPDMTAASQKLKGLSIFSGGGSLDRGLEEGGAVEFQTAVDLSATAMHTLRANARDPAKLRLYCGSVDDFLKGALAGNDPQLIARIGEVELIAAGSPCPGFSALQQDKQSPASLRNSSHISTFCSVVDLYRPQYGILENVVNMASTQTGYEDLNVLSQLAACLVSMGYQVNQFIMDAWNYGSAQERSRIFLTISAPGLGPIIQPRHTHSKLFENTPSRCLGTLPNEQRFGMREYYPTPFPHVSAGAITSDLPNIGNGIVQCCIPYPDHRLTNVPSKNERALLTYIPKQPPGCGYKEAYSRGVIPDGLQKNKKETGKAYRRIEEAGLVPTITTTINIQDSRNGASVHWSEQRPITLQEARRTQGWRDNELIIGSLVEQLRILGNGVDRKVAFAVGLSTCQAQEMNFVRGDIKRDDDSGNDGIRLPPPKETNQAPTSGVGKLSPSTMSALSKPATSSVHAKHSRDTDASEVIENELAPGGQNLNSNKRAKTEGVSPLRASELDEDTTTTKNTRQTRHSGLPVEFVPKNWNKKPEQGCRQKDRRC